MIQSQEFEIISVSRLNYVINNSLLISFPLVKVEGEVSQLLVSKMGHAYFTLKDEQACVKCVLFKSELKKLSFVPNNGDQIVATASPTIYSARGDFQLRVSSISRDGSGKLFEKFLNLKQKLLSEGLFDSERKIEIPSFFNCVGIVTSLDSAALRDALITFNNKLARVKLKIFPSLVQGESATLQLIQALNLAALDSEVEVILLIRGGGSLEDLWVFNEELLVRNLAKITKPIITGIGHETDTSLSDMVSDCRAATPTAAVERLSVEEEKLINKLEQSKIRLDGLVKNFFSFLEQKLDFLYLKIKSPRDELVLNENKFKNTSQRLRNTNKNLQQGLILRLEHYRNRMKVLDPAAILKRGFCFIYEKDSQNIVLSVDQITKEQNLDVQFADGNAKVTVNSLKKNISN